MMSVFHLSRFSETFHASQIYARCHLSDVRYDRPVDRRQSRGHREALHGVMAFPCDCGL